MDQTLLQSRKQSVNQFSIGSDDIKLQSDKFFRDILKGNVKEENVHDDHKKIMNLQLKLQAKETLIEAQAKELERQEKQLREKRDERPGKDDLAKMYNDIESLNLTIDHLKKENSKLKTAMLAIGAKADANPKKTLDLDEIDGLLEKINFLDYKLKEREADTEELKRQKNVESENADQKKQVNLQEDNIRKIGLEDQQIIKEKMKAEEEKDLREKDFRRISENYDELVEKLKNNNEEKEAIKQDREKLVETVLNQQKTHENEICNLRGTMDYIAEKMQILNLERESKEVLAQLEERHKEEVSSMERVIDEFKSKCEKYEMERGDQTQKVSEFMKDLQMIEQNLHEALNDKEKVMTELEKEKLKNSKITINLEEAKDSLEAFKSGDYETIKNQLGLLSEKNENQLKDLEDYEKSKQEFQKERENNNQILKMSKDEIATQQKMVEDLEKAGKVNNQESYQLKTRTEQIAELEKDMAILEKDRQFFKSKVERLEEQVYSREKAYMRLEQDNRYGTDTTIKALKAENDNLREELKSYEQKNQRLQRESELNDNRYCTDTTIKALKIENDNLREELRLYEQKNLRLQRESEMLDMHYRINMQDHMEHVAYENDRVKEILRRRIEAQEHALHMNPHREHEHHLMLARERERALNKTRDRRASPDYEVKSYQIPQRGDEVQGERHENEGYAGHRDPRMDSKNGYSYRDQNKSMNKSNEQGNSNRLLNKVNNESSVSQNTRQMQ